MPANLPQLIYNLFHKIYQLKKLIEKYANWINIRDYINLINDTITLYFHSFPWKISEIKASSNKYALNTDKSKNETVTAGRTIID